MRPSIALRSPAPPMIVVESLSTTTRLAGELRQLHVLELDAQFLGHQLAARQRRMSRAWPCAVAEAGAFTATQRNTPRSVDDQRRERLAFEIVGDQEQRPPGFRHLLEQRISP